MPGPLHDARTIDAAFRLAELYDRQWKMIELCELEPDEWGMSWDHIRQLVRYHSGAPDVEDPIELRIEREPEVVYEEVQAMMAEPRSRAKLPKVLEFQADAVEERDEVREAAEADDELLDLSEHLREYSLINGSFIFALDGKLLSIEYDRWAAIVRDYSNHGTGLTSAEIARKYGIPRQLLIRALRMYGQFKASPPVLREAIEDHRADFTPLISGSLENDELRFLNQLETARDQRWRKEYREMKNTQLMRSRIIDAVREALDGTTIAPPSKNLFDIEIDNPDGNAWECHAPTSDEHSGLYNWSAESFGDDYDTPEACRRLMSHADHTALWVARQPGRCAKLHRSFMGDLFHALMGETAHGTGLDQDTRAGLVMEQTMQAILYGLYRLAPVADEVIVRGSKGNHDGFLFTFAMMMVREMAHRSGLENVRVEVTPGYFDTFRVGTALHVLDHGYGVGSLEGWKAKAQAEVVAREIGGADYHGCDRIYTYTGHKHEEARGSHGSHLTMIRLESLAEADEYATGLRYAGQPAARLWRLGPEGHLQTERILTRGELRSEHMRQETPQL